MWITHTHTLLIACLPCYPHFQSHYVGLKKISQILEQKKVYWPPVYSPRSFNLVLATCTKCKLPVLPLQLGLICTRDIIIVIIIFFKQPSQPSWLEKQNQQEIGLPLTFGCSIRNSPQSIYRRWHKWLSVSGNLKDCDILSLKTQGSEQSQDLSPWLESFDRELN